MKQTILQLLCSSPGKPLSGVKLSKELGISRVAVWKHIQALNSDGHAIASSPKGYCLTNPDDLLLPFVFPNRQQTIHYFPTLDSTMDTAKELARQGAPHMSVIIAGEQARGRGRLNRHWISSEGGLWFTVILRPALPPPFAFKVNFAASLCLARTLEAVCGIKEAGVKWPNDILYQDKKLAGLLSEMETQGDMLSFVTVGIGLNVNNHPEHQEPNAVSVNRIVGTPVSRQAILSEFLDRFETLLTSIHETDIIELWKQKTSTIGRHVSIETPGAVTQGLAIDVDTSGALIVQQADGEKKSIIYGDCFHREPRA